ncbi:GNAT superfamily N-acetyltransferase [Hamadaea flava]|uniref:GNAT family N-acetyltransferase n=1 Tax=Hamadaea flava TaxID=1742688 RepID=A0ABV8LJ81_9ACTN|nr:GNAT family N-acetyltransferase [Hamadaea flava]MCP2324980.1 GNAT superfamily N-acetyltransferase [Hamadaea flava]
MSDLQIRPVRYGSPVAQRLVQAIYADQEERYGSSDGAPVEAMEFDPPDGGFLVAYLSGEAVGCAGWRSHGESEEIAELKRLYCAPAARNRGVASALVAAVEENAREHGRKRMILETGDRQPEAIALYAKLGYADTEHYGFYKDESGVVSMARDL